ncbi:MAG: hypothetical protein BV458_10310 [Thermoplasmata archaeon M9B2D]|nr:MAG: hypothetical protein BV458_10310 [Thermoplasmata archaeon M9B2D]
MKTKVISLLICMLFLTSVFAGLTTAKNLAGITTNVTNIPVDLSANSELIKITTEHPACDIDGHFVVYANDSYPYLHIYDIETAETENVYVGGNIIFPKISDDRVVYYDFSYMGFKMYKISTGEKTDLIVTNWEGGDADSYQFFGDYIVYENFDFDLYSTEIFLYTIATSENIQLTDTPGDDYTENPCIYENIVAWQLCQGNLNDIVMYDIDSNEYTRVTNTSQFESETFPSIYDDTVVYSYFFYDKTNGTILYGLKMYTISTGEETTFFTGEEPTANSPEVFGDIIVYSEPDGRLCLYDVHTHTETLIYENSYLTQPWNLNEEYVVFTVLGEGVYLYKYTTSPVIEIGDITGGLFKVNAVVRNAGDAAATNVEWSITLTGGFIFLGKESTGTIPTIAADATADISSKVIIGFGTTVVTVTADTATKSQNATVLLVFIKI